MKKNTPAVSKECLDKKKCHHYNATLHGMVTVGPKGQIVIPVSARKEVGINPGDQVLVVVKIGKAIGLVKANEIEELHRALAGEMKELKKSS